MPVYTIRDPQTGRTLTVRGDSPPTEQELEQLFAHADVREATPPAKGLLEQATDAGKAVLGEINPLPAIDAVGRALIPEAVGNAIGLEGTGPVNAINTALGAQYNVFQQAQQRAARGDYVGAAAKGLYAAIPILGPKLSQAGDEMQRGDVGTGAGRAIGAGLAVFGPPALANAQIRVPAVARNTNPVDAAAVDFAHQQGIPVDAGTATGRQYVKTVQKRAADSLGGFGRADAFRATQSDAMARVGDELAGRSNATPLGKPGKAVDTVRAGEAVRGRLESKINAQARVADTAYDRLRELEQQQQQVIARTGGVKAPATAAKPFTDVPLAVDVSAAKQSLRPLYEQLSREKEVIGVLQGGKARTLVALDNLMKGPDQAPLSVVDAALGDLKAMARTNDLPALRTQGQATAAEAVKGLEQQVTAAAKAAGPEVYDALQRGRQATIGKYETAAVRDTLSGEPAQITRQLTTGKEVNLDRLRAVAAQTPREIPKIARAWLEDKLGMAQAEGGFAHGDKLWAEWQKLGPDTKQILFKDPGLISDLDNFFLLAKRISQNPNPPNTATTLTALNVGTAPLTYTLAKMLYSRRGVQALTQGFTASLGPRSVFASRAGSAAELAKLAREFAAPAAVPAAAEEGAPTARRRSLLQR